MTKVCSQVDDLLVDFANLMQVQNLQATLNDAFENYRDNISRAEGLLAGDSVELQEIYGLFEAQEVRKSLYNSKIEQYTKDAASHFNKQVSEDLTRDKTSSPRGSVRSQSSRASRLSAASARLYQAKIAVERATLLEKQTEQKRTRTIEARVKLLELEMKQKQFVFQHQLELAKLQAEKEVEEARERTEMAELECKLAGRELSGLLPEENRPERHIAKTGMNVDKNPGTMTEANPQPVSFQGISGISDSSTRALFPISRAPSHAFAPTLKETATCLPTYTCAPPFPVVSQRVSMLPAFFFPRSSIHVRVCFFTSNRALARLNVTCVFVARY